ncbi:RIB43A-like with coiled-coils protein 1 [Hemicordylus capensis]|uniref:RIB43A-like with coiled-coils protein 1 n=1 Tax=Hemicordylus capensis TaxID=884348 RepID=UPI002302864C|nr:RIB43A-like with coiled-coils protein 1 [Hemicordylus capensis]XP_053149842.1 RIB43A-like with coiled-coils protein 1 [Hemicordylus capensis]XP_053149844.1 RIB43A-like with coiled-coils protein 1 [Hemicordylus capensis]XP_053149845.1 RIB43A-like with coiled-coils protein 1 [Hemicordylus capensis]XP_053149846.1 RIB43A-like with coiled-coils protein 1 [Hemicordylus capensis]XP_053149847.1 RIB43A-like with coiled-coils protein 1 [Hemicordylus capensis]XP_053149848.1 RIB43A-like with coiled-co
MYKVDICGDTREAIATEARRNREKQRQSRIFNARYRTMGVDVEGLKSQVAERKLHENAEKRRDEAFDADRMQCDKIAQMLEEEERQRKKRLNQATVEFWEQEQQPSTRREWDIQDSEAIRKGQPARVSDDDPRCGPSSMQRFAGEDLNAPARHKLQKEQNKRSLEEQRAERQKDLADHKYADTLDDKKRIELDLRALELARLEEECRKAKAAAVADFNRAQAAEVAQQQRLAEQREQDDNYTEIYNHLTGDILTENPDVAKSLLGEHRLIPYCWKGMSPEELAAMYKMQAEQCKENQRLRQEERQRDAEWEQQQQLADRAAMEMEAQEQDFRLQLRKSLDAYNRELADAQKSHLRYLEKEVYSNAPTAQYHLQFNTSSR